MRPSVASPRWCDGSPVLCRNALRRMVRRRPTGCHLRATGRAVRTGQTLGVSPGAHKPSEPIRLVESRGLASRSLRVRGRPRKRCRADVLDICCGPHRVRASCCRAGPWKLRVRPARQLFRDRRPDLGRGRTAPENPGAPAPPWPRRTPPRGRPAPAARAASSSRSVGRARAERRRRARARTRRIPGDAARAPSVDGRTPGAVHPMERR
jgi:hypothetical protein